MKKTWVLAPFFLVLIYFVTLSVTTQNKVISMNPPPLLCGSKPNCVSSYESRETHFIEPLKLISKISLEGNQKDLKSIILSEGGKVVEESETYIRAEFTSLIFRFVDDLEVILDGETHQAFFRSKSRVGYSDLGVNRKRVLKIQFRYNQRDL